MLLDHFKQYIRVKGLSEKTVGHYVTGINTINALLVKYNLPIQNIFETTTIAELETVKLFLESNMEFQTKNSVGHNMYSVAFGHFCDFVCGDMTFFNSHIDKMDIVAAKPQIITTMHTGYKRNQIIIEQALEGAHYCCEHNSEHQTFIAKTTGYSYMEGHHLIPMRFQHDFKCSIDVYANIVCLCPLCHRQIHYGTDSDRKYLAEELYEKRNQRLMNSGIDISKKDFIKLVV